MDSDKVESLIQEYLTKKYSVESLILHGSRANGYAKEHSDRDLFVLTKKDISQEEYRVMIDGSNVEYIIVKLPLKEDQLLKIFGTKLRYSKVIFDKDNAAQDILNNIKEIYKKGPTPLTEIQHKGAKDFLLSNLDGIRDNSSEELIATKYFCSFYSRAIRYWYQSKNKHSEPIYIATKDIEDENTDLHLLLKSFVNGLNKDRYKIGTQIIEMLFVDKQVP